MRMKCDCVLRGPSPSPIELVCSSSPQLAWRDENPVLVRVDPISWRECRIGKADLDVALTFAALVGLQRMRAERLHADRHLRDRRGIANAAENDETAPAVVDCFLREQIAEHRTTHRS